MGKYADDPRREGLAGLDAEWRRKHSQGWTVPASHLKYGEDPRRAARRVAEEVLLLRGLRLSKPGVETEHADGARPSGTG